jgi:hypothetical protein
MVIRKKSDSHSGPGPWKSSNSLVYARPYGPPESEFDRYAKECEIWFPAGRNPWRDLYTPEVMAELSSILRLTGPRQIEFLRRKLCRVAELYVYELSEGVFHSDRKPKGITYNDRIKWIEKNIRAPIAQLRESLAFEDAGHLSYFPDLNRPRFPERPQFAALLSELEVLDRWALEFVRRIRSLLSSGSASKRAAAKPWTDLKYAVVWTLLEIYVHMPAEGKM